MTMDEFLLTEENLKLFNNIQLSINKRAKEIGIKYAERFDIDYHYINIEIDQSCARIAYCEFDEYHTYDDIEVEDIFISFNDLLNPGECIKKLIEKRAEDEREEKIGNIRRHISNLKNNRKDHMSTIESLDKIYKDSVLELYELEGMKILGENPDFQKVYEVERRTSGEICALMLEFITASNKTYLYDYDYDIIYEKNEVIIKFWDMVEDDESNRDYYLYEYESDYSKKYTGEELHIPYEAFNNVEKWVSENID